MFVHQEDKHLGHQGILALLLFGRVLKLHDLIHRFDICFLLFSLVCEFVSVFTVHETGARLAALPLGLLYSSVTVETW